MYRILKVIFNESTIRSVISLGRLLFWNLSLISTQLTILFLNAVGVALMIKSIYLGAGGGVSANSSVHHQGKRELYFVL